MGGVAQQAARRQQVLQQLLACAQWHRLEVEARGVQQIEGVEGHRIVPRRGGRGRFAAHRGAVLQQPEARCAALVVNHHFAVDGEAVVGQPPHALDDFREALGQIDAAPRGEAHVLAVAGDEQPVAVVLHLEQPAVAAEGRCRRGQHRRLVQRLAGLRPWAQGPDALPKRRGEGFRIGRGVQRQAGEHGVLRQRPGSGPLVPLLDQQPLLPGIVPPLQPDQREAAAQLVAVQREQQFPGCEAAGEVLQLHVGALIPHQHMARAVVAGRNLPLEIRVFQRMVLHLHREALVLRVHRRPLGHCPGAQHVVDLEPKVPMQPRRRMLLHHEQPPRAAAGHGDGIEGLRRGRGAAAFAIDVQSAPRASVGGCRTAG